MDIEIGEVTSELTMLDLRAIKAEILHDVMSRLAEEDRLKAKRNDERRIRQGATDRPDEVA